MSVLIKESSVSVAPSETLKAESFWIRQFDSNPTVEQNFFDSIVGVLLPLFCLGLLPLVVRQITRMDAAPYPVGGIVAIGLSMVSLAYWLLLRRASAFLAGVMFASAALALMIGVLLFPLSVVGTLFAGVGLLGLSPFPTSFTYARNAVRVWRSARCQITSTKAVCVAAAGCLMYAALPCGTHWYIANENHRAIKMLTSADPTTFDAAARTLRRISWMVGCDELVCVYEVENDPELRQKYADLYRELSGKDIVSRLESMND